MHVALPSALAAALMILTAPAWADPQTEHVDFSSGTEGWVGLPRAGAQGSWITPRRGESGAGWRTRINDTFGLTFRNDSKDRKSTRLNSSHTDISRMPSSA
mgnify:CR=1 FL=1